MSFFETSQATLAKIAQKHNGKTRDPFLAIADGLVALFKDEALTPYFRTGALDELLKLHAHYFPSQLPVHTKDFSTEDKFTYAASRSFKTALAYTLRQLAINCMLTHPSSYESLMSEKMIQNMRAGKIELTETLHAMLHALVTYGMPIQLGLSEQNGYDLPVKHIFGPDSQTAESDLTLELNQRDRLFTISSTHEESNKAAPSPIETHQTVPVSQLARQIQHLRMEDEKRYFINHRVLQEAIKGGQLSLTDLIDAYVSLTKFDSFTDARDHHLQALSYSAKVAALRDGDGAIPSATEEKLARLTDMLAKTLTTNNLSVEDVFATMLTTNHVPSI